MKYSYGRNALRFACVAVTAFVAIAFAPISRAQIPSQGQMSGGVPNQTAIGQSGGTMTDQLQYGTLGHQAERDQVAAYNAFFKEQDPAKKIQL